jgi:cysteine desulfurase / selenocysteine lyase
MWRSDFPLLDGNDLVYLDTAASAQKPASVLAAMHDFYTTSYANVHRSVYPLADRAGEAYEGARATVARFIGGATEEIVFVRNATEAINLAAHSYVRPRLGPGKRVITTIAEHHANYLPWLEACKCADAELVLISVAADGEIDWQQLRQELRRGALIVAIHHISNVMGTKVPIEKVANMAHATGALLLVDGTQAVPHIAVDVAACGADFYVFSGHKMYGPTGIGVLWARSELLAAMDPFLVGGDMVQDVTLSGVTYADPPHRFEAGTPPVAEAVGLAAAADYLTGIGFSAIREHEDLLLAMLERGLYRLDGVELIGGPGSRYGAVPFVAEGVHSGDLATILGASGVAVRAGFHCAQPLHAHLGLDGTCRASVGIYNDRADIGALVDQTARAIETLRGVRLRRVGLEGV